MPDLFPTIEDLGSSGYLFRIQDNGGATADRYTVVFCDGTYIGMSSNPTHPLGFSQAGEDCDPLYLETEAEEERGVDLSLGDLPEDLRQHILDRTNSSFEDALAAAEAGAAHMVAPTREAAEEHEGTARCGGKGIYRDPSGQGFRVRCDGQPEEDPGPFATAREALVATLPGSYALSGPEYHPRNDPGSLSPTPDAAEALAALEERVERGEVCPGEDDEDEAEVSPAARGP